MIQEETITKREAIFISKATPGDDEFVLWLAPRLEAAGYTVFADILNLEPGDRWRRIVTNTLQNKAVKMLLCCRDASLEKQGVQEEIGIAEDLVKELKDPRFIIPLRLAPFKKIFGIGELQYVDFVGSWASGLRDLLETLKEQSAPRSTGAVTINPTWENYKKRLALKVEESPEVLTSNWLRMTLPEAIRYYRPPGPINHDIMEGACAESPFPAVVHSRGFFSFASPQEVQTAFARVGTFEIQAEHNLAKLLDEGLESPAIQPREAKNMIVAIFRRSFEDFCRSKSLHEYTYSKQSGFHFTKEQVALGKRISWGREGVRRLSVLRNISKGKVWQYGVSAIPYLWPFPHFRLKSRVLFAELSSKEAGPVISDIGEQHRLRRSVCKGRRNKAWHGRLMAFLELLAGESAELLLPLSPSAVLKVEAQPLFVTSPVTTALPDEMGEEAEEQDASTLGQFSMQDDD
jgi:TIR domain